MDDGTGKQQQGIKMTRKISLGMIATAMVLAVSVQQPAQAQSAPKTMPCNLAWCPVLVQVVKTPAGAESLWVSFDQIKMAPKFSGATLTWKLVGSPDYEFRADSVMAKGTNAALATAQFPVRIISANEYAHDNLNKDALTYGYEVRVYKKGSPASSTPLVSSGTVVNAN
jgi:hypothetical protein